MAKIAIIGAGGFVFPLRLVGDLLSFPELRDSTIALMDIDATNLERTSKAVHELVTHHGFPTRIQSTLDRREALTGADYVIVTFQVGGLEAYRLDVEIPRKYGIDQAVGDTLGPGGVFRFLRSAAAYQAIAEDMKALCPNALLLNYANPMAMNCWLLARSGIKTVGLCHSVQNTSQMLAAQLGVPYNEVRYLAAGINHQAWFLEFRDGSIDLQAEVLKTMRSRHLTGQKPSALLQDFGDHSNGYQDSNYEGGQERVRTEVMNAFGYFHTESSHHASEYLPYFRKNAAMVQEFIPNRWDYYQVCTRHNDADLGELLERLKTKLEASLEYGARIVHSIETNTPIVVSGNVENRGLISNLPEGCCVEVPCLVDGNGVQPTAIGALPAQCAAVNRTNINVQELAVEAILSNNLEHVYHAIMLDPLTAATLRLEHIKAMVDELLIAQAQWLPVAFAPNRLEH
jgi:alpha-galactosidase